MIAVTSFNFLSNKLQIQFIGIKQESGHINKAFIIIALTLSRTEIASRIDAKRCKTESNRPDLVRFIGAR